VTWDWKALTERIIKATANQDAGEAALAIVSGFFEVPADTKARTKPADLARIAMRSAAGKYASLDRNARAYDGSPRTLWRYHRAMALPEFQRELRHIWRVLFRVATDKYGFGRYGFDVLIDEFQTHFFGYTRYDIDGREDDDARRPHPEDQHLTEVGLVAGASKDDKYSGKFHALTYQAMVVRCKRSGVVLPLDIVLVSTEHPLLVGDLRIESRSRVAIIRHFTNILRGYREVPRIIMFDRGYHANENYAEVDRYCKERHSRYMTPAPRQPGVVMANGTTYSGIRAFCEAAFSWAKALPNGERYVIAERPVKNSPGTLRTLLVLYHPRKRRRSADLPEGAIEVSSDYWASPFCISDANPEPHIRWWAWIYTVRWCEENWFKSRSANYHDGRGHKVQRRMLILMVGIICLALYALLRIQVYPDLDIPAVSRYFNTADYTDGLLRRLEAG